MDLEHQFRLRFSLLRAMIRGGGGLTVCPFGMTSLQLEQQGELDSVNEAYFGV